MEKHIYNKKPSPNPSPYIQPNGLTYQIKDYDNRFLTNMQYLQQGIVYKRILCRHTLPEMLGHREVQDVRVIYAVCHVFRQWGARVCSDRHKTSYVQIVQEHTRCNARRYDSVQIAVALCRNALAYRLHR